MALDPAKNFAKVTVSTGYDASATSIVLTTGHGAKLPAVSFNAVWWNSTDYADPSDDPNVEIVRVTAIASDTLTVTRGQESISATTKNTAGKVYKMAAGLTAKVLTDIATGGHLGTSALVANAVTQSAFAEGSTSGPTTTSTTYVDMTDMSLTVTSTGGIWLVDFSGLFTQSDNTKKVIFRIVVDGSEAGQSYRELRPAVAAQGYTVHSMWLGTIAAGSKVIKVQWAADNSGTCTAISTKRQLRAFELKR